MERDTLIKLFALLLIVAFILEMFAVRSSVTTSPTDSSNATKEQSVYGAGNATATLISYSDYLTVFKSGADISNNSTLEELKRINGVGYINRHEGTLVLVLEYGANASQIAREVKERFPDLNVTARALFSLPPEVKFVTAMGERNVSFSTLISIEIEPEFNVGENVTLSLVGLVRGNVFEGTPIARIIPTESEVVTKAVVDGVGGSYYATVILPWSSRNINATELRERLSTGFENVTVNYFPDSYVVVKGLSGREDEVVKEIYNISYVEEVYGDVIYVKDEYNDSGRVEMDLKGILGENITVDYPLSKAGVSFNSSNFSEENFKKLAGGEVVLYRQMFLKVGERLVIEGREYEIPENTRFEVILLNSFSVGDEVTVQLRVATVGRRVVKVELERIVG
ncbi:MAG: hypothetical protein QXZ40_00770 [Candidatus Micrarchaeia archaeon]